MRKLGAMFIVGGVLAVAGCSAGDSTPHGAIEGAIAPSGASTTAATTTTTTAPTTTSTLPPTTTTTLPPLVINFAGDTSLRMAWLHTTRSPRWTTSCRLRT